MYASNRFVFLVQNERRLELHELNSRAWDGENVFQLKATKLDSSIKRNTGFIKKLRRGFTKEVAASLIDDLREISLEKYLSEVVTSANEALSSVGNKNDDIVAAVEVISGLHQRFSHNFTGKLMAAFLSNFDTSGILEKDIVTKYNKLKGNIRVLTELYLVGVFTSLDIVDSKDGLPAFIQAKLHKKEPVIFWVLKGILNYNFRLGYTTSLGVLFAKKYYTFFDPEDHSWDTLICDTNLKALLQSLFSVFTNAIITRALSLSKQISKLLEEHRKCQIRTGKPTDEYLEEYESLAPVFERFKSAAIPLAELFHVELSGEELDVTNLSDTKQEDGVSKNVITNSPVPPSQKLWENEETRKFYEVLPDIKELVKISVEKGESRATSEKLNDYFERLASVETKDEVDAMVLEYWEEGLDNKATRNRLLRFFMEFQDWKKIKLYARYVAIDAPYCKELLEELIKYLDNGFRSQLYSNKINVKNIMFYSEMFKFMLLPTFMVFHKIRTLLLNIQVPNNADILTIFLEQSGRFLLNKPEYEEHVQQMVQLLKKKASERELSMSTKSSLRNILTFLFPPSMQSLNIAERKLLPEELFYHVLIRRELSHLNFKQCVDLIRRAHWSDRTVYGTLFELFTTPEKVSYQNIVILAKILGGLYPYQRNFVIKCIDGVLENIERGLEIGTYSENMHRVANVKYLSEIFNLELVKSNVILYEIYHIINYGHFLNRPSPFHPNEGDPPDSYFRIHLVSTVLLSLKRFPRTLLKQLSLLLRYFEYYTFIKDQPLPKETQFVVSNVFEKLSAHVTFIKATNLSESTTKLDALMKTMKLISPNSGTASKTSADASQVTNNVINLIATPGEGEDNGGDDDGEEDDNDEGQDLGIEEDEGSEEEYSSSESVSDDDSASISSIEDASSVDENDENESDSESDSSGDTSNSDDDDEFSDIDASRDTEFRRMYEDFEKKLKTEEERKVEDEFERQYRQIMQESMDERKSEKVSGANMPMISGPLRSEGSSQPEGNMQEATGKVTFAFLSKSGKKTTSRAIQLPTTVKFVSGVLREEEKLKNEREKIKNIVLQRNFD